MLPKWMKPYCATNLPNTQTVTFIAPGDGVSPVVAVVQPPVKPQQKRYLPILPRTLPCPPQVSPILQNCNKSKSSQIMPNKSKLKSSDSEKHVINKFRAIKPKPSEPNTSNSNTKTSCINDLKISDVSSLKDNVFLQNQTVCLPSKQTSLALPMANEEDLNQTMFLTSEQIAAAVPVINNQELNQATSPVPSQKTLPVVNNEVSNENQLFRFSEVNEVQIKTEICDETGDNVIDNEQDLGALMTASNTIYKKRYAKKKRSKLRSDLESSLALLQPNLMENKQEEKEALFANSYLLRVTETLKSDPETWESFLKTLCNYQNSTKSPVELFFELKEILKNYPVLADDFIAFLRPDQARNCGKYKEYVALRKIREFLQRIEMHFCKEPQHLLKILKTFAQLRRQTDVTSTEVLSALLPLLKNHKHLVDELSQLLPDTFPSV
ncbi:GON-4-like protein, partial [Stegodyphus mimosarum]